MPETEAPKKDQLGNPEIVSIATSTFYPKYYKGALEDHDQVDKIRGDLALQMIEQTIDHGYQIAVVDGNSSDDFKKSASNLGIKLLPENARGMSAGRRQAILAASQLPGVQIVTWTEPEKVSMVRDCISTAVLPIILDYADIVIPERGTESFATYPDYQVSFEQRANQRWNKTLRKSGLYKGVKDLDAWIGPRLIRNDPELIELFMKKYVYKSTKIREFPQSKNLENWANSIFLPLVSALDKGYRVTGQTVPYIHPTEQTALEQNSPEFQLKRSVQYKNINMATDLLVRHLQRRDSLNLSLVEAA